MKPDVNHELTRLTRLDNNAPSFVSTCTEKLKSGFMRLSEMMTSMYSGSWTRSDDESGAAAATSSVYPVQSYNGFRQRGFKLVATT